VRELVESLGLPEPERPVAAGAGLMIAAAPAAFAK
jgi:hypothetical protein